MDLVYTTTTTLEADGTYVFVEIEMAEGTAFLTTVDFNGVFTGRMSPWPENGSEKLELPIQVFETSTDSSLLSVDRLHYFFELVDGKNIAGPGVVS